MNIQVYADLAHTEAVKDSLLLTLEGVDVGQVIQEFNAQDVLDCLDMETIKDYLIEYEKDE